MARYELMGHQEEGVSFLLEREGGIVAFEQGLGKTLVAIDAFQRLRGTGGVECLLVVCPNSLKRNWVGELDKFAPDLEVSVVAGRARERREILAGSTVDVVIINYAGARNEITAVRAMLKRRGAVLVFDESHHLKNRESLTSIAARQFAPLSKHQWLLTGTPITNEPEDAWAQVKIATGGREPLGSYDRFALDFGAADEDQATRTELNNALQPFLLRRTKEDCLDLPEKSFSDLYVELSDWQLQLYEEMRDGFVNQVRGMSEEQYAAFAPTALTRLLRLAQIASNPALVFEDENRVPAKMERLDRLMEKLVVANGRNVIVWSYYVDSINRLADRYERFGAQMLYGDVDEADRQEVVRRFQEDENCRVLIANPAAAGTGFTLTEASYAIYESLNWRYDLYAQSQDRNHRIGQDKPVNYLRLLAVDTIDEVIAQALERKTAMAKGIMGDKREAWSPTEMTPDQFCRMLETNSLPA